MVCECQSEVRQLARRLSLVPAEVCSSRFLPLRHGLIRDAASSELRVEREVVSDVTGA